MYYVLMKQSWDYNDEHMYQIEEGGGHPKKVFTDKDEANAELIKLEKAAWIKENVNDYNSYDTNIVKDITGVECDPWDDWSLPKKTSDEDFVKMIKKLGRTLFYEIVPVKE